MPYNTSLNLPRHFAPRSSQVSSAIMRKPYNTPEYGQDGRMSLQRNNFGDINMVVLSGRTTRKWIYLETYKQ